MALIYAAGVLYRAGVVRCGQPEVFFAMPASLPASLPACLAPPHSVMTVSVVLLSSGLVGCLVTSLESLVLPFTLLLM